MRSLRRLTLPLMLCGFALAASGCGARTQVRIQPLYPPSADLAVEQDCPANDPLGEQLLVREGRRCKPVATADIVTSAQAAAKYDIAVESWGIRGWQAVARICRWAKENGAEGLSCPEAE